MKQPLRGILLLALGAGCQTTPAPNPLTPTQMVQTHMLRLMCKEPNGLTIQSRIAVLDIGDPLHDFGFATGHALPEGRPCVVKDFASGQSAVNLIRLAENYRSGDTTDWAIIRFDKINTQNLVRYTLDPIEDIAELLEEEFSFAQARGLSENAQKCSLSILDFSEDLRRVVHNCRAIPGQSGSPIIRIVNGTPMLIGLHIGHLWMMESPLTGRPDRKGYINLLDQKTVDEIEAVIEGYRS